MLFARRAFATAVKDTCVAAELTTGSFFHRFNSKGEMLIAATDY